MFGFSRKLALRNKGEGIAKDAKVKATILHIFTEFFRLNPDNGVVYICSQEGDLFAK
jgi:hypothetical protein